MKKVTPDDHATIASTLRAGGIVVLRTDTIYGITASAEDQRACDKIFELKSRDADKACIVLIADDSQMWDTVSRTVYGHIADKLDDSYPTSLIVPVAGYTPHWIHHHDQTVAFRIPRTQPWLMEVLRESGPIIAPSANLQGQLPARNVDEAYAYFGEGVDLYVDGGTVEASEPSHVYRYNGMEFERLR